MKLKRRHGAVQPTTPCGLALNAEANEVVLVEESSEGTFDIFRLPLNEARAANITTAEVRTVVLGWSAHTDRSPLQISPESDDKGILESLIQAAAQSAGSAELRYTFSRTRDNKIVLIQAQRAHVEETTHAVTDWLKLQRANLAGYDAEPSLRIETATRSIARLWLAGPVVRPEIIDASTTVFLTVSRDGYGVGFFSTAAGYVYETEEAFRTGASEDQVAWHIYNNLLKMTSASSLNKLSLEPVKQIVISCVPALRQALMAHLNESPQLKDVRLDTLRLAGVESEDVNGGEIDQLTALAMGAVVESDLLPHVDLARDLQGQLTAKLDQETKDRNSREQSKYAIAAVAILVPFILVSVFLSASWYFRSSSTAALQQSNEDAKARLAQLNQENKDYESAKVNFGVIGGLITQITTLRERQAAPYQFLVDLDQRIPADKSWYFSEVNTVGANVEIKGKTRNEQAVTVFTRNLENSEGLFSNIFVVNNAANATANVTPGSQPAPSSGVMDFVVKAVYSPLNNPPPKAAPQIAQTPQSTVMPTSGVQPPGPPPSVLPGQAPTQPQAGGQK
jgi:Tfp pilus assembly protein PilN